MSCQILKKSIHCCILETTSGFNIQIINSLNNLKRLSAVSLTVNFTFHCFYQTSNTKGAGKFILSLLFNIYLPLFPVLSLCTFCSLMSVSWLSCLESNESIAILLSSKPQLIQSLSKLDGPNEFPVWCSLTASLHGKTSPSKLDGEQWHLHVSSVITLSSRERSEKYLVSPKV